MDTVNIPRKQFAKTNDIYNVVSKFKLTYKNLSENTVFKIPENNRLIKMFIDAKWKGNYSSLIYQVNNPESTLQKNICVFKTLELFLNKQFDLLTQSDIDAFQLALNTDAYYTHSNIPKKKTIAFRYKQDLVKHLKQFWQFYRLYAKNELKIDVLNIVEYIRLRRPKNQNHVISFIKKEEIEILISKTLVQQMRAFLSVYYELGGRVVEMLLLKNSNCRYDDNKSAWIIHLPNEKGISTAKMPIELSFSNSEFHKWMISRPSLSEDDYVFQYSYDYIKNYFSEKGKQYIGRHLTPKQMRKGTTMYLINNNVNEQYIRAHLGWSASSKAIGNYINQRAIKRPDQLNGAIQKDFYSDVIKENDELKFKQKIQDESLKSIKDEFDKFKQEQADIFKMLQNVELSASKNLLKTMFSEWSKDHNKDEPKNITVIQS